MINTKKLISIILAAALLTGIASCSAKSPRKTREEPEVNIAELHKISGPLLEVKIIPSGEMTREQFEAASNTMTVTYSGDVILPNPVQKAVLEMSDEDFVSIYEFCIDCYEHDKYANYSEDVCDGTQYSFIYYDQDGQSHKLYSGYIYGNDELSRVVEIVSGYMIE